MATTYDFIAQNKRRTWLLVLLFPITFVGLAYLTLLGFSYLSSPAPASYYSDDYYESDVYDESDGYYAEPGYFGISDVVLQQTNELALKILPWIWLGAVAWIIWSYYMGASMLLSGAGGIRIERDDQPELYRLVENLCIAAGLPMPAVYILNDSSLNAFATGRDPQHASIALTKGIIQRLERAELEGVVAHELCHIQNRDIRLMLITVAGISFCTFLAEICFRIARHSSRGSGRNKGGGVLIFFAAGVFFAVYGYCIAPLLRLAVSRTREYQADATAALLTRNPAALANALEKISIDPAVEKLQEHASMAAMCIENPLRHAGLFATISGLFSTHPPTKDRIAALRQMDRGY